MLAAYLALLTVALLGHAALWVGFVNRAHASGIRRWIVKRLSDIGFLLLGCVPLAAFGWFLFSKQSLLEWISTSLQIPAVWCYVLVCTGFGFGALVQWCCRSFFARSPAAVCSNHTVVVDVAKQLGYKPVSGIVAKMLAHVPGNQALQFGVHEKVFQLPRLPAKLDGLSIAHLTDLHITGCIGREYFEEVARQTNELRADLIAITGDIIDEPELLDWVPAIFSQLTAPLGVYFVLGNHDEFTNHAPQLRAAMTSCGIVDLGGRVRHLDVGGVDLLLAGNELPWFSPAPDLRNSTPCGTSGDQFRVLLAHTPDQFGWARQWDFDLMLAGHNHGGQICLPLAGPIFSPSWHGVKYASGTFYAAPTLLHVSRGISSELPIRLRCRPELVKLILRPKADETAPDSVVN